MATNRTGAIVEHPPFPKQYAETFLELEKGKGCDLFDTAGNRYLDFGSGIAVNALGHGRKDLAKIAAKQMERLVHVSNLYTTAPAVALAERLITLGDFSAVHFGSSGTEANESAIKLARMYGHRRPADDGRPRTRLLCFEHGFHGRTMGALSVTPSEKYQTPFGPLVPDVTVKPFNDTAGLSVLEEGLYCGVIVEPVQGEGGLDRVTEEFAHRLNQACREHDVLLIADEVQTGLGRCGYDLASRAVGLSPDIVTLAKPLAGGLPLSATLIPKRVDDLLHTGEHGTTFGGGPVTTAVAGHVVDTVLDPGFLKRVQSTAAYFADTLSELVEEHGVLTGIKGLGMLVGITIDESRAESLPALIGHAQELGLLILRSGTNVIRLAPPLVIDRDDIDRGVSLLSQAVAKTFR